MSRWHLPAQLVLKALGIARRAAFDPLATEVCETVGSGAESKGTRNSRPKAHVGRQRQDVSTLAVGDWNCILTENVGDLLQGQAELTRVQKLDQQSDVSTLQAVAQADEQPIKTSPDVVELDCVHAADTASPDLLCVCGRCQMP